MAVSYIFHRWRTSAPPSRRLPRQILPVTNDSSSSRRGGGGEATNNIFCLLDLIAWPRLALLWKILDTVRRRSRSINRSPLGSQMVFYLFTNWNIILNRCPLIWCCGVRSIQNSSSRASREPSDTLISCRIDHRPFSAQCSPTNHPRRRHRITRRRQAAC